MRRNQVRKPVSARRVFAVAGAVAVLALAAGGAFAFSKLRALYREQCVVRDMAAQVFVNDGEMVKGDVVADAFGIRLGANLAEIDFDAKRREILGRIANIRDITVRRRLPGRVCIAVTERTPSVRLNWGANRRDTGRVADAEGVVFTCRRGTAALPVVREASAPGTQPGKRLEGLAFAALQLAELSKDPAYQDLGVLEVDCSRPDYLLATLGDYSRAKVAWEDMERPGPKSNERLSGRLRDLADAVKSHVGDGTVTWNATQDGRIYAKGGTAP